VWKLTHYPEKDADLFSPQRSAGSPNRMNVTILRVMAGKTGQACP
jgi:hypothetical protein